MSGCNATLHGIQCARPKHPDRPGHPNVDGEPPWEVHRDRDHTVRWTDSAPGAKPHTPPRYRAVEREVNGWDGVWDVALDHLSAATFYTSHPDPKAAAEAHARQLNGEDEPCQYWRSAWDTEHANAEVFRAALERARDVIRQQAKGSALTFAEQSCWRIVEQALGEVR